MAAEHYSFLSQYTSLAQSSNFNQYCATEEGDEIIALLQRRIRDNKTTTQTNKSNATQAIHKPHDFSNSGGRSISVDVAALTEMTTTTSSASSSVSGDRPDNYTDFEPDESEERRSEALQSESVSVMDDMTSVVNGIDDQNDERDSAAELLQKRKQLEAWIATEQMADSAIEAKLAGCATEAVKLLAEVGILIGDVGLMEEQRPTRPSSSSASSRSQSKNSGYPPSIKGRDEGETVNGVSDRSVTPGSGSSLSVRGVAGKVATRTARPKISVDVKSVSERPSTTQSLQSFGDFSNAEPLFDAIYTEKFDAITDMITLAMHSPFAESANPLQFGNVTNGNEPISFSQRELWHLYLANLEHSSRVIFETLSDDELLSNELFARALQSRFQSAVLANAFIFHLSTLLQLQDKCLGSNSVNANTQSNAAEAISPTGEWNTFDLQQDFLDARFSFVLCLGRVSQSITTSQMTAMSIQQQRQQTNQTDDTTQKSSNSAELVLDLLSVKSLVHFENGIVVELLLQLLRGVLYTSDPTTQSNELNSMDLHSHVSIVCGALLFSLTETCLRTMLSMLNQKIDIQRRIESLIARMTVKSVPQRTGSKSKLSNNNNSFRRELCLFDDVQEILTNERWLSLRERAIELLVCVYEAHFHCNVELYRKTAQNSPQIQSHHSTQHKQQQSRHQLPLNNDGRSSSDSSVDFELHRQLTHERLVILEVILSLLSDAAGCTQSLVHSSIKLFYLLSFSKHGRMAIFINGIFHLILWICKCPNSPVELKKLCAAAVGQFLPAEVEVEASSPYSAAPNDTPDISPTNAVIDGKTNTSPVESLKLPTHLQTWLSECQHHIHELFCDWQLQQQNSEERAADVSNYSTLIDCEVGYDSKATSIIEALVTHNFLKPAVQLLADETLLSGVLTLSDTLHPKQTSSSNFHMVKKLSAIRNNGGAANTMSTSNCIVEDADIMLWTTRLLSHISDLHRVQQMIAQHSVLVAIFKLLDVAIAAEDSLLSYLHQQCQQQQQKDHNQRLRHELTPLEPDAESEYFRLSIARLTGFLFPLLLVISNLSKTKEYQIRVYKAEGIRCLVSGLRLVAKFLPLFESKKNQRRGDELNPSERDKEPHSNMASSSYLIPKVITHILANLSGCSSEIQNHMASKRARGDSHNHRLNSAPLSPSSSRSSSSSSSSGSLVDVLCYVIMHSNEIGVRWNCLCCLSNLCLPEVNHQTVITNTHFRTCITSVISRSKQPASEKSGSTGATQYAELSDSKNRSSRAKSASSASTSKKKKPTEAVAATNEHGASKSSSSLSGTFKLIARGIRCIASLSRNSDLKPSIQEAFGPLRNVFRYFVAPNSRLVHPPTERFQSVAAEVIASGIGLSHISAMNLDILKIIANLSENVNNHTVLINEGGLAVVIECLYSFPVSASSQHHIEVARAASNFANSSRARAILMSSSLSSPTTVGSASTSRNQETISEITILHRIDAWKEVRNEQVLLYVQASAKKLKI